MQSRVNSGGGYLTFVSDSGYTIEGRAKGFIVAVESDYADVYNYYDHEPILNFQTSETYVFEGEFDISEEGYAYKVTQNFLEVIKSVAIKGDMRNFDTAALDRAGVPFGAKVTSSYDKKNNETTFKWTERVTIND